MKRLLLISLSCSSIVWAKSAIDIAKDVEQFAETTQRLIMQNNLDYAMEFAQTMLHCKVGNEKLQNTLKYWLDWRYARNRSLTGNEIELVTNNLVNSVEYDKLHSECTNDSILRLWDSKVKKKNTYLEAFKAYAKNNKSQLSGSTNKRSEQGSHTLK
ncbi:uncharacterized protein LOC117134854 [Drosophila busckii]|uniref:uncharacterized protein LOC117134854 n=1 Tax=Drosophila busckii TaxID=30019 RepID=UPI0014330C4C|nr:uncharacterized protein LOC117134854 [Drosophila busckii]